jgi:DNA-binding winged helix-turn-helix (wHTH) protein
LPLYHFGEFVLSPRRRVLLRHGREQPLIPRYFDLLVFLIERRHEAVHRQDIFEQVWRDVSVADTALSQAIRTLRRTLDDDPREPRFIRTVSRHGYRFVFDQVREEPEETDDADNDQLGQQRGTPTARWAWGSTGPGIAGALAGAAGGLILAAVPDSEASLAVAPVLALIGAACGALGGAGVAAGILAAEASAPAYRSLAITAAGAIGGGLAGFLAQWLARWSLETLVGVRLDIGGGLEGLVIGAAAAGVYAVTPAGAPDDTASPLSFRPSSVVLAIAAASALAALALTLADRPLVAGTVHLIAAASSGSQAVLTPLARLVGEPEFGPITGAIIGTAEGLIFGAGLGWGLTPRPRA